MTEKPRLVALYLPQYHPIAENDEWWGRGFTEWTNVTKATPIFPGHKQPNLPADLGFYDLRVPETRTEQAKLAEKYGIEAFCYYHYWFGGRRIIQRPFDEVLTSGEPNFPFCLFWANETWSGVWHGEPKKVLIEQTYPGEDDHRRHFENLLPAFQDSRYITVDDKPVFLIYRPMDIPDLRNTMNLWRRMAVSAGLRGLYLIANSPNSGYPNWRPQDHGFDASITTKMPALRSWITWHHPVKRLLRNFRVWRGYPTVYQYKEVIKNFLRNEPAGFDDYPVVIPNWDNTPRSGANGLVLQGSTPELFRTHLRAALDISLEFPHERQFVFIKSWNEWAEGNYLEPDRRFGKKYLEVVREEFDRVAKK
ncbi:MAG: glycoside hydrolase family 99-like domain-containing protein [Oxalobacteraceae bacterium]